jgi:hypothetical protein
MFFIIFIFTVQYKNTLKLYCDRDRPTSRSFTILNLVLISFDQLKVLFTFSAIFICKNTPMNDEVAAAILHLCCTFPVSPITITAFISTGASASVFVLDQCTRIRVRRCSITLNIKALVKAVYCLYSGQQQNKLISKHGEGVC